MDARKTLSGSVQRISSPVPSSHASISSRFSLPLVLHSTEMTYGSYVPSSTVSSPFLPGMVTCSTRLSALIFSGAAEIRIPKSRLSFPLKLNQPIYAPPFAMALRLRENSISCIRLGTASLLSLWKCSICSTVFPSV